VVYSKFSIKNVNKEGGRKEREGAQKEETTTYGKK
jgi:hypothetical protein